MNKRVRLLLLGFLPLLIGFALDFLPLSLSAPGWSLLLLGMMPLWFAAGWATLATGESVWKNAALAHLPALLDLLLVLWQLLARGAWWRSWAGGLTQSFFLPFLLPAYSLEALLPAHDSQWPAFALAFAVMLALFILGGLAKRKRAEHRKYGGT